MARTIAYIDSCPRRGGKHDRTEGGAPSFTGVSGSWPDPAFICPTTGEPFTGSEATMAREWAAIKAVGPPKGRSISQHISGPPARPMPRLEEPLSTD